MTVCLTRVDFEYQVFKATPELQAYRLNVCNMCFKVLLFYLDRYWINADNPQQNIEHADENTIAVVCLRSEGYNVSRFQENGKNTKISKKEIPTNSLNQICKLTFESEVLRMNSFRREKPQKC